MKMRALKKELRQWLEGADWEQRLPDIAAIEPREAVGPLLALLPVGGDLTRRAAVALGLSVGRMAAQEPEAARNIMRRLMWHMNEESGNIGWGVPEAFAEILARSERLTKEFGNVLISYIADTGRDDNFCDHAILRRSCFWAVGRLCQAWPEVGARAVPWLHKGFEDEDAECRAQAAWALEQLPEAMRTNTGLTRPVARSVARDTLQRQPKR